MNICVIRGRIVGTYGSCVLSVVRPKKSRNSNAVQYIWHIQSFDLRPSTFDHRPSTVDYRLLTVKSIKKATLSLPSSKVHRMITIPAPLPPPKKKIKKNQKKIIIDKSCQFHVVTLHFQMKNIYFSEISRIKSPFVTFLKYFIYL